MGIFLAGMLPVFYVVRDIMKFSTSCHTVCHSICNTWSVVSMRLVVKLESSILTYEIQYSFSAATQGDN